MDDLKHYTVQLDIPISAKKSEAGRGCFGAVYQSKINGAPCVVKKLHDILTGVGGNEYVAHTQWKDIADKFQTEIRLLSQQRHPNIVQFLGVCGLDGDPRDICLVMEQMDVDLDHFIKANKGGIPLELKLRILTDTASGVSHLHANGIIHRDLNSGNVLLSSSLQAKVADLGGSRIIGTQAVGQLSLAPGAVDYMPPEAMRDKPVYGPKLDCFSFGHLSLYFALEVYPRPCEPSIDIVTLGEGLQFQKRRQWFEQLGSEHPLYQISVICLEDIPELRWEMGKIIDELRRISGNHSKDLPNLIDLIKENEQQRKVIDELKKQKEVTQAKQQVFTSQQNAEKDLTDGEDGPLGSFAPPWLPDSSVSMCQLCGIRFTVTRRRHHCRGCGLIFCGECSSYVAPLAYKNNKFSRVCQTCYSTLTEGEEFPSDNTTSNRSSLRRRPLRTSLKKVSMPSVLTEVKAQDQSAQIGGYLFYRRDKSRQWKKKWFVVFNLVMYEFKKHEDVSAQQSIPLPSYEVTSPVSGLNDPLVFSLQHPGAGKLLFKAEDEDQLERWVEVLQKAVRGETIHV